MIIFGDSLSDAGNTGLVNNYYKQKSILGALAFPNEPGWTQFPGGATGDFQDQPRFTNNLMWWDFLGERIKSEANPDFSADVARALPYNPYGDFGSDVYLAFELDEEFGFSTPRTGLDSGQSQNWAWGGAKTATDAIISDDGLLTPDAIPDTYTLPGVSTQINHFMSMGQPLTSKDAVFIFAGANDYLLFNNATSPIGEIVQFLEGPVGDRIPDDFGTTVGKQQVDNIQTLIDNGATNIVVLNLPDIAITPAAVAGNFDDLTMDPATYVDQFNTGLRDGIAELDLSGVNLALADIYSLLNEMISDPSAFGFDPTLLYNEEGDYDPMHAFLNETGEYNPLATEEDYEEAFIRWVFWGHVHPSQGGHQAIGDHLFDNIDEFIVVPEPRFYAIGMSGIIALLIGLRRLVRRKFGQSVGCQSTREIAKT